MYEKWLDKNFHGLTSSNYDTMSLDKRCSMLYSSEFNFIYSKSIKTASTSVEAALEILIRGEIAPHHTNSILYENGSMIGYRGSNPNTDPNINTKAFSQNHDSLEKIRDRIGSESFNSAIKISSIRNPYDRTISAFHHLGKQELAACVELKKAGNIDAIKDSFSKFLKENSSAKYTGYRHFFCDSEMVIDHFVRKEQVANDLNLILKRLDVPVEILKTINENIPTHKLTNRGESILNLSDYYSQESLDIVNERLSRWFKLGGYDCLNSLQELDG